MPELTPITDETPLVSVIIPSYNSRPWIGKALDSLFEQTYTNLEIIVVDDGSTDDTRVYLEENYSGKINYFYQPNSGLSNARNTGLRHATGLLIQFLDADDWLLPEKIERQVNFLEFHPEYDVAYCSYWISFNNNIDGLEAPVKREEKASGDILGLLTHQNVFVVHAALVRQECFDAAGVFFEGVSSYEDLDLWLRIAGAGFLFGYIDKRDVVYRLRKGSLARNYYNMHINRHRVCAHVKQVIPPERLQGALNQNQYSASFEFSVARALFEKKEYKAGLWQFLKSLKARHPHRFLFTLFSLIYVTLVPFLGYLRLEKSIIVALNIIVRFSKPNLQRGS